MAYVFRRPAKDGKIRFTAMYKAENGQYRSAGTYDDEDRAQQVADESERHAHLRLAETSPAEKATITVKGFVPKFLREHAIEPNSRQRYAEVLRSHAIPYIGHRRVAEISRETFHRLLTVVLKDEGVGQPSILYARTALSAMMQMAWDHGYREDNPLRGIRLKGVPGKPIVVATSTQFQRVYDALPHQPAKVFARLGVASGVRLCELISFTPEDFNFDTGMLSVNKSTVEITAEFHPEGHRFLTRSYTKNGDHRRFKIDATHLECGSSRCPAALCLHSVSGPAYARFLAHRQGGGPGACAVQARSRGSHDYNALCEDLGRRGLHRRGCHRDHPWRRGLENRRRQCERP